jgi:osmotically-inducible protein OsmY
LAIPTPAVTSPITEKDMHKPLQNVMRASAIVLGLAATGTLANCSATNNRESTGEYVDDATVSTKVRAAILQDPNVKISDIKVTTYRGVTQLSGFVDNQQMISRAEEVAKGVNGVKSVKNDLHVKPPESSNR